MKLVVMLEEEILTVQRAHKEYVQHVTHSFLGYKVQLVQKSVKIVLLKQILLDK